jgi:hypothetical protein
MSEREKLAADLARATGMTCVDWQPRDTMPARMRVLVWVTCEMRRGLNFGSAYRVGGKLVAKPEGCNGDWTKDISHWAPVPKGPAA